MGEIFMNPLECAILVLTTTQLDEKNNPMKNVVVTGGAGLIGSQLTEILLNKGYKVICIDNFISGSHEAIKSFINNENFTLLEHDVTKELPLIDVHIDWVFHLASPEMCIRDSAKVSFSPEKSPMVKSCDVVLIIISLV